MHIVLFKQLSQGIDVMNVYSQDRSSNLFFQCLVFLRFLLAGHMNLLHGELTSRLRMTTLFSPAATMASTRVRPTLPVPPATATVTILSDDFFEVDSLRCLINDAF